MRSNRHHDELQAQIDSIVAIAAGIFLLIVLLIFFMVF